MTQHTIRLFQVTDLIAHKRVWIDCEWEIYEHLFWRMLDLITDDIISNKLQDGCYPVWLAGNSIAAHIKTHPDSTDVTLLMVSFGDDEGDDPDGGISKMAHEGAESFAEFALENSGRKWSLDQTSGMPIKRPNQKPIDKSQIEELVQAKINRVPTRVPDNIDFDILSKANVFDENDCAIDFDAINIYHYIANRTDDWSFHWISPSWTAINSEISPQLPNFAPGSRHMATTTHGNACAPPMPLESAIAIHAGRSSESFGVQRTDHALIDEDFASRENIIFSSKISQKEFSFTPNL